jgi:hypothetical protein
VSDVGFYRSGFSFTCGGVPNNRPVWNPVPSSLTARKKFALIQGHSVRNHRFLFPERVQADGKRRRFQSSRLEKYPRSVYSKKCNAGFCLPCLLFPVDNPTLGRSYTSPLENFTRFKTECGRHNHRQRHINSVTEFLAFEGVTKMVKAAQILYGSRRRQWQAMQREYGKVPLSRTRPVLSFVESRTSLCARIGMRRSSRVKTRNQSETLGISWLC